MSDAPKSSIVKLLFSTTVGRSIVLGTVIAGVAFVARYYYLEQTKSEAVRTSETIQEQIDDARDAIIERMAADGAELPADTPWAPAFIECAGVARPTEAEANHPTWKALGIKMTPDTPTRYQLRFRSTTTGYSLLARSDSDCDGVYEVFRVTGTNSVTGLSSEPVRVDNPGE